MPLLAPAAPSDPLGVRHAVLSNGLTILLSPNPEQPRVFCRVVVRAGAAQEPRETTGLAHYLEHMLANKGTRRLGTVDFEAEKSTLERIRALYDELSASDDAGRQALYEAITEASAQAAPFAVPNELKQLHGRLGSRQLNAYTSHDQTSYVVDIPSGRLQAWAMLEADRFANPVFRSFQTEVETVREEKKRSLDNASRQTFWAFMSELWGEHPYGSTVLGRPDHLLRPSMSAMRAFFETWYVPNNMAVVLSGDLDPEATLELLESHLGGLERRPLPEPFTPVPPEPSVEQRVHYVHRGQPEVRLGWRTVGARHEDRLALELLDRVLQNDGTGLLDRLGQAEKLRSCGCWHRSMRQGGYLCIWGRPRAGQTVAEVEALLVEAVETIRRGDIDSQVLAGILRNLEVDELAALETNQGRADTIAEAWLRGDEPGSTWDEIAELHRLTVDDVTRVAQRYLGPVRVVVSRSDGEPELPPLAAPPLPALPAGAGAHSRFFGEVLEAPAQAPSILVLQEGVNWQSVDGPGLRVVRGPNPHVDIQRIVMRWPVGWQRTRGLGSAMRLWDRSGAGQIGRAEFEERLYELAASVALTPGRWTTDVALSAPVETALQAVALIRQRLVDPTIEEADAQRYVDDLMLRRQQSRSGRDHSVQALAAFASRGEDSVFLRRLQEDELRDVAHRGPVGWSAELTRKELVVLSTGPIGAQELSEDFVGERAALEQPGPLDFVRPTADRVLFLHHPSVQAQVTLYAPQGGYTPDDYGPRRLYAEVLGGSAGLVFQEVREKRGMAYSARGGLTPGWRAGDANLAWMQAGTQADKAADVAALLLRLLREFPADAARLERVRASSIARRRTDRVGFRAVPATVEDWLGKGITSDPVHWQLEQLAATPNEAVRAYANAVAAVPLTIAVVGDRDQVDLAALRALAPLTEVTLDEITVS